MCFCFIPHTYEQVGGECLVKVTKTEHGSDELLKCQIQAKMKDDTFIVFIEELKEKRLVPCSHLRPLHSALTREFFQPKRIYGGIGQQSQIDRYGYDLHGNTKSRTKRQRTSNFGFDYDAICNSGFDFEPYINLSNFTLAPTNSQRELIAYPMAYTQSGNMNSNNSNNNNSGGNQTGNTKSMKNRQQPSNGQHQTVNDGDNKLTALKIDTDNSGSAGIGGQYGKNGHESKIDSRPSSVLSSSAASFHHNYQHQQQHQMPEPNVTTTDASTAPAGHPPMSSYYHQGTTATATAPVYYYQASADEHSGIYSPSEMVHYIPTAYQATTSATAPPTMPGMYGPAISSTQIAHYPVPVSGWSAYTQPINPQGKIFIFF